MKTSLLLVTLLAFGSLRAEDTCTSAGCHGKLVEHQTVHAAAEVCEACHTSTATPHPQPGKKTFALSEEPPKLCFGCHDAFGTKKHVHPPAEAGLCTSCHDPHAADQPKLLLQPLKELCVTCHSDLGELRVQHPPFAAGECTACHAVHESDAEKLLVTEGNELCLGCHADIESASKQPVPHAALDAGCTTCHNPHGSDHARMFTNAFPAGPYAPYTETEYELCFSCHDRALVAESTTESATGFRNGQRNLHALHVNNPTKGRSCVLCHAVHGASSPKLIAESVPFGQWRLPLKFVATETGGSCSPGCHRPQSYAR